MPPEGRRRRGRRLCGTGQMLGIVLGDPLTGLSSFLVPLAHLTVVVGDASPTIACSPSLEHRRGLAGVGGFPVPGEGLVAIPIIPSHMPRSFMAPALPTSAAFWNLARLGVVSVHTLAVVIQQSQVVHRLGSLKSILRASEITEEELLETAFQPVTLSLFFWDCTRSAPASSGTQDSLPDPKAEKPVQWINADILRAESD